MGYLDQHVRHRGAPSWVLGHTRLEERCTTNVVVSDRTQGIDFRLANCEPHDAHEPTGAQALVGAALERSQVAAAQVALVAVHGTGTPLGDPLGPSVLMYTHFGL